MLYQISYTTRNKREKGLKFVNNASDLKEAVSTFWDWFFELYPDDAVRLERCTLVEIIGDMSQIEAIDAAVK